MTTWVHPVRCRLTEVGVKLLTQGRSVHRKPTASQQGLGETAEEVGLRRHPDPVHLGGEALYESRTRPRRPDDHKGGHSHDVPLPTPPIGCVPPIGYLQVEVVLLRPGGRPSTIGTGLVRRTLAGERGRIPPKVGVLELECRARLRWGWMGA